MNIIIALRPRLLPDPGLNYAEVSNFPICNIECVRKVTRLECKFINNLFHIRDSIRTEFRVNEHNQSRIRRLYVFQARDFPHTFNATYTCRNVRYSSLLLYTLGVIDPFSELYTFYYAFCIVKALLLSCACSCACNCAYLH